MSNFISFIGVLLVLIYTYHDLIQRLNPPHEKREAQLLPNYFSHSASTNDSLSPLSSYSFCHIHLYEENYFAKTEDALENWC